MKIRMLAVAGALVLFSAPAFAFQCPKDIAAIDTALAAGPKLSADRIVEAKALRDEGESFHKIGLHAKAVKTLAKAMDILKIKRTSRY